MSESISTSTPAPRQMPKPGNWLGVGSGIAAAKQAIAQQDLVLAEQCLREVLEFAPAEAEAWHILAAILKRKGCLVEARDCLRKALQLRAQKKPMDVALPASKRMAKLMWAQGDAPAALQMLAVLLQASPDDEILLQWQQAWQNKAPRVEQ